MKAWLRSEFPSENKKALNIFTVGMLEGKPLPKLSVKAAEVKNLIKPISHFIQQDVSQHRELGDVVRLLLLLLLLLLSFSMGELIDKTEGYTLGLAEVYQIARIGGGVQPSPEHCH